MIVETLTEFLQGEDFAVSAVDGQSKALELVEERPFDLVLLDIALIDGNGYAVCRGIKELRDIPVIFLTASDDEFSVVTGLDLGADDYIGKPFRPRELVSRMKSVLRRYGKSQTVVKFSDVTIDTTKLLVKKGGEELYLSALEYRILLLFATHPGQVFTRNQLLSELWDMAGEFVNDNTLTVYIKRLREKIEDEPQNPKLIKTVRGVGYVGIREE
ncbi:MAG: response regulator transcription factor [Lachnospiraceae bacterium]|nr:response regulator transcription factor [Lachnospiraceae bacterium]